MTVLTDWLLHSVIATSATLLMLLAARPLLARRLGAHATYAFWLALPLQFLLSLPGVFPALPATWPAALPPVTIGLTEGGIGSGVSPATLAPLVLTWLIGLLWVLADLARQLIRARDLSNSARPLTSGPNGIAHPLYESDSVQSPVVAGLLAPRILLPPGFFEQHDTDTATLILRHEASHHRWRDNLVNLFARILVAMQWFNPLAWIGLRAFRTDQEVRADADALTEPGSRTYIGYAHALLDMARETTSPALTSAWLTRNTIKRRILMLEHHRKPYLLALPAALAFALILPIAASALGAGETGTPAENADAVVEDVVPLVRINPRYPREAAENRIEGYVTAHFMITADGNVEDITILESEPGEVFDAEAVAALAQWRFKPLMIDGVPAAREATQQIDFELD